MVTSLQKSIQQLKGEINRYKNRAYRAEEKLGKVSVSLNLCDSKCTY